MSTMLEDTCDSATKSSHGTRLQAETTAVRLHIRWPGTRKSLSRDQKQQAAGAFDADSRTLSAAKTSFRHIASRRSAPSRRSKRRRVRCGKA